MADATNAPAPRLFQLIRDTDVSGISGTGTVAAGVIWPDGTVDMRWLTYTASTSCYDSIEDVEIIHGHQGATKIHFPGGGETGVRVFEIVRRDAQNRFRCVADGVEWVDGTVSVRWRGERASTVYWRSVKDAFAIHDHDGNTEFHFLAPTSA